MKRVQPLWQQILTLCSCPNLKSRSVFALLRPCHLRVSASSMAVKQTNTSMLVQSLQRKNPRTSSQPLSSKSRRGLRVHQFAKWNQSTSRMIRLSQIRLAILVIGGELASTPSQIVCLPKLWQPGE